MSLIKKMLRYDKAVYWPPVRYDDFGRPIDARPQQIDCRWEDCYEQYTDDTGRLAYSTAKVFFASTAGVQTGGALFHGTLTQLKSPSEPMRNPGAFEVRRVYKLPNIRNKEQLCWCYLSNKGK